MLGSGKGVLQRSTEEEGEGRQPSSDVQHNDQRHDDRKSGRVDQQLGIESPHRILVQGDE